MSNLPIGDDLKKIFDDVTSGRAAEPPVRAILVQNDGGLLRLIDSLPPEGTDREDFSPILGKLFAKEPMKPGYALYRLDSKSPAGLYEWLNCAFRPEGAKVRDKMQYSVTQASLFQGLNEQHFLETVYGATASEFSFPTRLRNVRKHDYQNPQKPVTGKPAAEAAGTDAGGARRNFETVSGRTLAAKSTHVPDKLPAMTADSTQTSGDRQSDASPEALVAGSAAQQSSTVLPDTHKEDPELPRDLEEMRGPIEPPDSAANGEDETDVAEETGTGPDTVSKAEGEVKDESQAGIQELNQEIEEPTTQPRETGEQRSAAVESSNAITSLSNESVAKSGPASVDQKTEPIVSESAAPVSIAVAVSNQASLDAKEEKTLQEDTTTTPRQSSTIAPQAISSIGTGKGAQGLETEKEKQLAQLKAEESRFKSGAAAKQGTGGPNAGFAWHDDVEQALGKLPGTPSSASVINLVVLKLDLSQEEVQLAGEPQSVEPEQLASALSGQESAGEPRYAFYAHPQAQSDAGGERQVGLIYICPTSSTVRQRMLYSVNLATLSNRVDSFDGMKVVKRTETSDVADLTPEFLAETFAGEEQETSIAPTTAGFSRPKRPGRK